VGGAFDPNVDVGPLMHQAAFDTTVQRVADAREKGARITVGGAAHERGGWFFEPTVVADAAPGMRIYDEENFAPISAVAPFESLDEVVERANDTEYGLAAYVCAKDINTVFQLIRRLDFAMVSVNGAKFTGAPIPFGGIKSSGLGREGGVEGFEPFVETRYFCLGQLGLPVTDSTPARAAGHAMATDATA
jgi:aspartate-semialdehyde dehydrogenase